MNYFKKGITFTFFYFIFCLTFYGQSQKFWNFNIGYSYFNNLNSKPLGNEYVSFNKIAVPNSLNAEKHLFDNLDVRISGVFNNFESIQTENTIQKQSFFAADLSLKYNFTNGIGKNNKIDPFVFFGFGYSNFDSMGDGKILYGGGVNLWLKDNLGIQINTSYNDNFEYKDANYLIHGIGIFYDLNGKNETNKYFAQLNADKQKDAVALVEKETNTVAEKNKIQSKEYNKNTILGSLKRNKIEKKVEKFFSKNRNTSCCYRKEN